MADIGDMIDPYGRIIPGALQSFGGMQSPGGMQRRTFNTDPMMAGNPAYLDTQQDSPNPVDKSNMFYRGMRREVSNYVPNLQSALGAGQAALGYTDAGRANLEEAEKAKAYNQARDPAVSLADARKNGNWGDWAADTAGAAIPAIGELALGGGVGGAVTKSVVGGLARRGAEKAALGLARRSAEEALASGAIKAVPEIAEKYGQSAAERAIVDQATEDALPAFRKTVNFANPDAGLAANAAEATASKVGSFAGTAGAALPGTVSGHADDVLAGTSDADTQTRAQKALAGGSVEAALQAVVPGQAISKIMGAAAPAAEKEIAQTVGQYIKGIGKGALKEGTAMAGLSVPQTAAALATHGWMTNNIDLAPPGALEQYLGNAITGFGMGAAFGAAHPATNLPHIDFRGMIVKNLDRMSAGLSKYRERMGKKLGDGVDAAKEAFTNVTNSDQFTSAVNLGQKAVDNISSMMPKDSAAMQTVKDAFTTLKSSAVGSDAYKKATETFNNAIDKAREIAKPTKSLSSDAKIAYKNAMDGLEDPQARQAFQTALVRHHLDNPGDAPAKNVLRALDTAKSDVTTPEARAQLSKLFVDTLSKQPSDEGINENFQANLDSLKDQTSAAQEDKDVDIPKRNARWTSIHYMQELFNRTNAPAGEGEGAARTSNPVDMGDPLKNAIAADIPRDHPFWQDADAAKKQIDSASKLFTGHELSDTDTENLQALREHVGNQQMEKWAMAGPMWADLSRVKDHVSQAAGLDAEHVSPDDIARGEDSHLNEDNPDDQSGSGVSEVATGSLRERMAGDAPVDIGEEKKLNDEQFFQHVYNTSTSDPRYPALQGEMRRRLIGERVMEGGGKNGPAYAKSTNDHAAIVANSPAFAAKKLKQGFEIESDAPNKARVIIDASNLVKKYLKERKDVRELPPGVNRAFVALSQVIGDLHGAGVKIKPETIKPGMEYAPGAHLSTAEAIRLRRELQGRDISQEDAQKILDHDAVQKRIAQAAAVGRTVSKEKIELAPSETRERRKLQMASDAEKLKHATDEEGNVLPDKRGAMDRASTWEPPPSVEEVGISGPNEMHELKARVPPAKSPTVANVNFREPYADIMEKAREAFGKAKTPLARRAAKLAAGREIGERRVENDLLLSDKNREKILKELYNPNGEFAMREFERAQKGEASATEGSADTGKPLKGREKDARYDKDIDVGVDSVMHPEGPHDHVGETNMSNAVLARAGIDSRVKVMPTPDDHVKASANGFYEPATGNIFLNPKLHGQERMEVLMHELGHHIIYDQLGGNFEKAPDELREALMKDYRDWLGENNFPDRKVSDLLASRKPAARAESIRERSTGVKLGQLTDEDAAYAIKDHEYFADQISRALNQKKESQSIIGKFFKGIADKLKSVYEQIFAKNDQTQKIAPSVDKWIQSLFDRTANDLKRTWGQASDRVHAEAATRVAFDAVHEGEEATRKGAEAYEKYYNRFFTDDQRRMLSRALDRGVVERQLIARYGHDEEIMKKLDSAERPAMLTYLAAKEYRAGRLKLGPSATEFMRWSFDQLHKLIGVASNNDFAMRMMRDHNDLRATVEAGNKYDVRAKEAADRGRVQEIMNSASAIAANTMSTVRKALYGDLDRVHATHNPALMKLAGLIKRTSGQTPDKHGLDFLTAKPARTQQFITRAGDVFDGLTKEESRDLVSHMQMGTADEHASPKIEAARQKLVTLMDDLHKYGKEAGIKMGTTPNYWPIVMDPKEVGDRAGDFKSMLSKPYFASYIDEKFHDSSMSNATSEDKIDALHKYALGERANDGGATDQTTSPSFSAKNRRVLDFIHKVGGEDDKKALASFQAKDPEAVLAPYIENLVNRAEFSRRFGEDGRVFEHGLNKAKEQGASDESIAHMRRFMDAATGRYGADGSPILNSLLGKERAAKVFNKKTQAVQDGLLTYENVRLLPLSLLSALADPLGIAVRTGGDFRGSWTAFKDGMKALKKSSPSQLKDMERALGMAGDYINTSILSNGFGTGAVGATAKRINDTYFKMNGLAPWVRATRYMALSMGQGFLLRHAAGDGPHSARYLRELGVKASDIQTGDKPGQIKLMSPEERKTATKDQIEADDRVRNALINFVDESILRPNVAQHPQYFNDPALRLFTQYKNFGYAFEQQIIERMSHELKYYNNYKVLAPFLAYIPVTVAAEMLRSGIQYGPGGNPNRDNWGPVEYANMGAERAGVLGPKLETLGKMTLESHHYGKMLGMPDLGPAVQQAGEIKDTLAGHHSVKKTILDALPASSLVSHRL